MRTLDAPALRRRYLTLLGMRWFPTGLLLPVATLLAVERGLSLAEIGAALSVQGLVVVLLELPTGGLADCWGRRRVLVLASAAAVASLAVLVTATSPAMFAVAWALQGVFRALDSGPLESWYVDSLLAGDPDVRLDRALAAGGAVIGVALGAGALTSGAIVAWTDVPARPVVLLPVLVALAVQLAGAAALVLLPPEPRWMAAGWAPIRAVPRALADGLRATWHSRALTALVLIHLAWGFGIVAVEMLFPVRLAEFMGTTTAAAVMGPAVAGAWLLSAAGAVCGPVLAARFGPLAAAVALRVLHGTGIVVMGLLVAPAGALVGFAFAYTLQGATNPLTASLFHSHVRGAMRTTMLSMGSMAGQCGFAVGLLALSAVAEAVSTVAAMVIGGLVLAASAPLYLLVGARR